MELDTTAGSICPHYHSWRSKSSQLRIVIAFSFACVASDLLGPAAEAHAHTHTHTAHKTDDPVVLITLTEPLCALWTLWKQLQLHLRQSFCRACRGLFSFESGTGQWCTCVAISWITCTHTHNSLC